MRHQVIAAAATYSRDGRQNQADQLIVQHSQLVRRIAWHVHSRMSNAVELEELMQIGMMALVEAGRQFEDRGIPFVPYASMRIRGAMIDELRRIARVGRSALTARKRLAAARAQLEHRLGRAPGAAEMAEELRLSVEAYHDLVGIAQDVEHLPIEESDADSSAFFIDDQDGPEVMAEKADLALSLARNIAELDEREALILNLYFVEEMNLHEIGELMSLTPARICQLKSKALTKLKEQMSAGLE